MARLAGLNSLRPPRAGTSVIPASASTRADDAGSGLGIPWIDAERCERAVVVEQQHGARRLREFFEETVGMARRPQDTHRRRQPRAIRSCAPCCRPDLRVT